MSWNDEGDKGVMRPSKVNILGIEYKIYYAANPSEVDIHNRESMWGQIDYWTRTIRIYDNGRNKEDIWQTLIHEVFHGIGAALKLKINKEEMHEELDTLAIALTDVLFRNGWINDEA